MNEMKSIESLSLEEKMANRVRWIGDLENHRICHSPVRDMVDIIYRLEDNASTIFDMMLDIEDKGEYSPYLQAAFDDTMDILDYLKNIIQLTNKLK